VHVAFSLALFFLIERERKKDGDRSGIIAECQKPGYDELEERRKNGRKK